MKTIIVITLLALSFSSFASLFNSEEKIEIQLEGNLSDLLNDRNENGNEPSYHKLKVTINAEDKVFENYKSVKTHGGLRALKSSCDYPPMIFQSDDDGFFPKGKVFFTSHCNDRESYHEFPKGNSYLHREYLAYKLYQLISDLSVKSRLANITYIDAQKDSSEVRRYGLFTQNINELAKKKGYQSLLERKGFSVSEKQKIDKDNYALVTMFQWLIGNRDFFIKEDQIRNMAIFQNDDQLFAVPFDFDMSVFVSRRMFQGDVYEYLEYDCKIFTESEFKEYASKALIRINSVAKKIKDFVASDSYYLKQEDRQYVQDYFDEAFLIIDQILKKKLDTLSFECK